MGPRNLPIYAAEKLNEMILKIKAPGGSAGEQDRSGEYAPELGRMVSLRRVFLP